MHVIRQEIQFYFNSVTGDFLEIVHEFIQSARVLKPKQILRNQRSTICVQYMYNQMKNLSSLFGLIAETFHLSNICVFFFVDKMWEYLVLTVGGRSLTTLTRFWLFDYLPPLR